MLDIVLYVILVIILFSTAYQLVRVLVQAVASLLSALVSLAGILVVAIGLIVVVAQFTKKGRASAFS